MAKRPTEWDALEAIPNPTESKIIGNFIKSGYDIMKLPQAALDAGVSKSKAPAVAAKAVRKMGNNPLLQRKLRQHGVSMDRIAKKISDLMDAKHAAYEDKPDNSIQLKATQLAVDLHEAAPVPRVEIDKREVVQINITADIVGAIERATGEKVIDVEPEPATGNPEE